MTVLESKANYIKELVEAKTLLPHKYMNDILEMLPEKNMSRVKNACSGVVQDDEVLAAVKKLAEKERKRRIKAARQELKALGAHV